MTITDYNKYGGGHGDIFRSNNPGGTYGNILVKSRAERDARLAKARPTRQASHNFGQPREGRLLDTSELARLRRSAGVVPRNSFVAPSGRAYDTPTDSMARMMAHKLGVDAVESIVPGRILSSWEGQSPQYYTDPLTLDTYNTIIENSDGEGSLPNWLPKDDIREAYKFLAYTNKGKNVEDWAIDKSSDIYRFLASLEAPPSSMLFPHQQMNAVAEEQYRRKYNAGGMDKLNKNQKLLISPFYSQPWQQLPKEEMTQAQKAKLFGKDVLGSTLAAMTVAPLAAIVVGLAIPGVSVGVAMLPLIGLMAAANFADRRLELDSPGMASVNEWAAKVWGALPGGIEKIYGTLELAATDDEFREVLDGVSEYTMKEWRQTAWQASGLRHDVRRESLLLDIAGGQRTTPDEIWRIEEGVPAPVKVDKDWKWGKDATSAIQSELLAGAEVDEVLSHWEEEFGFQGILSDLVMQNIFDPMNFLPTLSNRVPAAIASGRVSKIIKLMDSAGDFTKLAKAMNYADDASDINKFIKAFSDVDSAGLLAKLQATPEGADFLKIYGKLDDMRLAGNIKIAADQARGNAFIDALPCPVNMVAGSIYKMVTKKTGSYGGAAAVFENLKKLYTDGYAQDAARQIVTKAGKVKNFYAPPTWSPIERWLGGLDKSGFPKWATPTVLEGGLLKKLSTYLGSQTNSSKAIKFSTNFMTHVSGQMTGLKVDDQVGLLQRFAMLDTGDGFIKIEAKLNGLRGVEGKYIPLDFDLGDGVLGRNMQRIEIDPAAYGSQASFVFQDAIKKAISKGIVGNEYQKWLGTTDARSKLNQIANAIGVKPGKVLDYIEAEDTVVLWKKFKRATTKDPVAGFDRFYAMDDKSAASSIDSMLKIFTWDLEDSGKMAWSDELFHANMVNKLSKHIGEYVVNRYMLNDKNAITKLIRFTNINRQIQGALVLGLNPRYAIYNAVNNIATRVASDNFGYMRLADIDAYNKRFGFDTWNDAIDFGDWKFEGKGMDIQKTKIRIDDPAYKFEHEWMEKVSRKANAVSVFKRLSNNIEAASARKSYMNGLKKYWDNTWSGAIPGMDNINLPENIKKSLMAKAVGSLNMDELRTGIYGGKPDEIDVSIYTRRAAENIAKNSVLTPEILSEIIDESVMRSLKKELAGTQTAGDVVAAFDRVKSGSLDFIRRTMDRDFETRAADIQARVKDSGGYAVAKEYVDAAIYYQQEHIAHFRTIDAAVASMEGMTHKQMSLVWDGIDKSETLRFEGMNKWRKETNKALFGVLETLDPETRGKYKVHLDAMDKMDEMWAKFHKNRGDIWREAFSAEYADDVAKDLALDAARAKVDGMANKAYDFEMKMYDYSMDALFGKPRGVLFTDGVKSTMKSSVSTAPIETAYKIGDDVYTGKLHIDALNKALESGDYEQVGLEKYQRTSDGKIFNINEDGELGFQETKSGKFLAPEESRKKYDVASSKELASKYPVEESEVTGLPRNMTVRESMVVQQANKWFREVGDDGLARSERAWGKGTAKVLTDKLEAMGIKTNTRSGGGGDVYVEISENDWEMIKDLSADAERTWKAHYESTLDAVPPKGISFDDAVPQGTRDATVAWVEHIRNVRKKMIEAVRDHRKGMVDDKPANYSDRMARNSKFYNEDYTMLIMELHNAEIEGAMFAVSSKGRVPSQINNDSMTRMEAYMGFLDPMLDGMAVEMAGDIRNNNLYDGSKLTVDQSKQVDLWLNQVDQSMKSNKLQAVKYGETMKNYTMLDYTDRTGWDDAYSMLFPYQFWYTHSFRNWAMRTLDNTSMFSSFYRLRDAQKRMGRIGAPTRMKDKMRLPWAFLPEWAGGSTYFDPFSQFFPPSSLFSMLDVFNDDKSDLYRTAYYHLADMAKLGEITEEQAMKARETGEGDAWDMALGWADENTGFSDPYTLASQFMQPAMYVDIGVNLLKGTPEEIPPTPILHLSRQLRGMVDGVLGEGNIAGKVIGGLAWGEGKLRQSFGMTPAQAQFGAFGDYYVKRQLAGMMTMSEISPENYSKTLLDMDNGEYNSEWYETAYERALQEVNLKQPGYLGYMAATGGANLGVIGATTFVSMFPHGVISQGELEYRGHQNENNRAWEIYNATGDKTAMHEFYNEHPEYRLRSNIFINDPKLQAKSLLITNIWDLYVGLDKANQKVAIETFGEEFKRAFLGKAMKDEFSVELETLARWAQMLGSSIPESIPEAQEMFLEEPVQELDAWDDQHAKDYGVFIEERERLFPTWYVLQGQYYDLPENERSQYARDFPQFQEYRDWKADYLKKKPGISSVVESGSINYGTEDGLKGYLTREEMETFPDLLSNSLIAHFTFNQPLGAGALMMLEDKWITAGKPGKDFKRWLNYEIAPNYTLLVK